MIINATTRIELTPEQQIEAVVSILIQDYASIATSVHEYERERAKRSLESFELQDFIDMLDTLKGMELVLRNYMLPDQFETWSRAWAKTRKLYS